MCVWCVACHIALLSLTQALEYCLSTAPDQRTRYGKAKLKRNQFVMGPGLSGAGASAPAPVAAAAAAAVGAFQAVWPAVTSALPAAAEAPAPVPPLASGGPADKGDVRT